MCVYATTEEEQQQSDSMVGAQGAESEGGVHTERIYDFPRVPGQPAVQPKQHPALRTHLRAQLRAHWRQGDDRGWRLFLYFTLKWLVKYDLYNHSDKNHVYIITALRFVFAFINSTNDLYLTLRFCFLNSSELHVIRPSLFCCRNS